MFKIYFLLFSIFLTFSSNEPLEYTSVLLYDTTIGQYDTQISLILNTYSSNNILFTNIYRPYSYEINEKREGGDIMNDTIKLGPKTVKDLTFILIMDYTKLDRYQIQGELGLGIDEYYKNKLMDHLYEQNLIRKKQILLETNNDPENVNVIVDPEKIPDKFYYCNISEKSDLSDQRKDVWICEMSHLLTGFTDLELSWNNSEEINARIIFDSRVKYIYIPEGYLNLILDFWKLNMTLCQISENYNGTENSEKYIDCMYVTEEEINNLKPIYFVMEGYACLLLASDLFEKIDYYHYTSLIRFNKEKKDIWTLGLPFFKKYKVLFDYDYQRVGFSGKLNYIIDYNKEYIKWLKERDSLLNKESIDKKIMVIGAFMGISMLGVILFFLIKSIVKDKSRRNNKFIEEIDRGNVY